MYIQVDTFFLGLYEMEVLKQGGINSKSKFLFLVDLIIWFTDVNFLEYCKTTDPKIYLVKVDIKKEMVFRPLDLLFLPTMLNSLFVREATHVCTNH